MIYERVNRLVYEVVKKKVISFPITVSEMKKHLNLEEEFVEDDDYIEGLIASAERFCSGIIGSDIFKTSNIHTISNHIDGRDILVKENPLLEFTKMYYINPTDDSEVVIDEDSYTIYESQYYFHIKFEQEVLIEDVDKMMFEYITGFENLDIPKDMLHAIKIYVGTLYDQERAGYGDYKLKANRAVQNLLAQYIKLL